MGLRITGNGVNGIPSEFFPLEFWIDIKVWLFILLRSLFFWDVVLHHWLIDDQCFDTLFCLRTSGTIYTVTWHHITEEWKPQLYHHESVKTCILCCLLWRLVFMNKHYAGDYPSAACCGDLPICVILPVYERQVLKILVIIAALIQKSDFYMNLLVHIVSPDETCHSCKNT